MTFRRQIFVLGVCGWLAGTASAQQPPAADASAQPPPRGPAEIFQRIQQQQQRKSVPSQPSAPSGAAAQPGAAPHPPPARVAVRPGDTVQPSSAPPGASAPHGAAEPGKPAQPGAPGATTLPGAAPLPAGPSGQSAAALSAGHPAVDPSGTQPDDAPDDATGAAAGGDPHTGSSGAPSLARRPLATAEPSATLAAGAVRVRVVDQAEQPVAGAAIELGTMTRENTRETQAAKTAADGSHLFEKLPTGEGQAYRVNVLYEGAKFSSTPFRLPVDHGYDVVVRRLPVTRDARELVLYVGATSIELRDERLKVVQQARLINIGGKAIVFPEGGQLVKLPPEAIAFQSEELMTDQHLREEKGQGFRIAGSIPPGEVTLTWGFDLPHTGSDMELSFDLPWTTFAYRVLADAAPGMTVEAEGMPSPELRDENGRRFFVTELVKRVGDTPLRQVRIHLRGIPGPGPTRIIALVCALLVLGAGVVLARQPVVLASADRIATAEAFAQRKAALLARAAQLEADRVRGEIGPEYHSQQVAEVEEELAALLYEEARRSSRAHGATA